MAKFFMVGKTMRIILALITLFFSLMLTHCASYDFSRRVVEQGNLLPEQMIARIKIGMSKNDVAILTGSSLLSPTFNNDRWDYAYTFRKGNGSTQVRNLVLYFAQNRVVRIVHKHRP